MSQVRLGVDAACRADHRATLADDRGELLWSNWRFRTTVADLERLWDKIPDDAEVMVVMEPTRNAWVPLAAWFRARGAQVVMVPPEQSADLRDYYNKHTKTDRLDSRVLARLPLLHPDGLREIEDLGPAESLKRAVRRRSSLQKRRTAAMQRIDCLIEMMGSGWAEVLGAGSYTKTALTILERYADPNTLKRLGRKRLTKLIVSVSRGQWNESKADQLLAAANETLQLWSAGGLDFVQLAADIATEVRVVKTIDTELEAIEERIEALYAEADPDGIVISVPGLGVTLAAGILGRTGDLNRFANLAGVRSFTGIVPKVDQSGISHSHKGLTKSGDPGLRQTLYLAAEQARRVDPTLAARYHRLIVEQGKHHVSAVCSVASVLITRIAACWRTQQPYQLRDVDGTPHHRIPRTSHLRRPLQNRPRSPRQPPPSHHRQTPQKTGESAQKGVDQGRSGNRPAHPTRYPTRHMNALDIR